jgi:hypothetical protein
MDQLILRWFMTIIDVWKCDVATCDIVAYAKSALLMWQLILYIAQLEMTQFLGWYV